MNKYRNIVFVLIFLGMVSLLIGVTYSFFNYTRTGSANVVSVGNISFTSTQGPAISLSNVFPIDRSDVDTDTDNVGTVTINVTGSTNYTEGVEYLISAVDLDNEVSVLPINIRKRVPIGIDVTYSNNGNGTTIGTANDDYFDEGERGGDTSYYKVLATNTVNEGDKLVVGYIAPGETGINGNITIKAFFDDDFVAISDTVPEGERYIINPNMTPEELNVCTSFFSTNGISEVLTPGDTLEDFCNGTGTVASGGVVMSFQDVIDYDISQYEFMLNYFLSNNIIQYSHTYGTTDEWVNGRVILTTTEWNSLNSNGISFKIKVEANEGTWVDEPGTIAECPNCKFFYSEDTIMYMVSNTVNQTPTVVTTGLYDNYLDIVGNMGKKHFLGLVLNSSNQITKAYACGIINNKPFCVEGTSDDTEYANKQAYLQSENLWNNTCQINVQYPGASNEYEETFCSMSEWYSVRITIHNHGCAFVGQQQDSYINTCAIYDCGEIECSNDSKYWLLHY